MITRYTCPACGSWMELRDLEPEVIRTSDGLTYRARQTLQHDPDWEADAACRWAYEALAADMEQALKRLMDGAAASLRASIPAEPPTEQETDK